MDDATKATWLFLMRSKSKVRQLFHSFYAIVSTQIGVKIKTIRTNNAKEFDMPNFLNSHGIIHYVYTPQQNSIVERKHQHLLSIARVLQIQSQIPIQFWDDYVLIVAYLINKLAFPLLNDKIPFELPFKRPPNYYHLKVFGCLCFASTIAQTKNKFSPRARKCVFIGYPFNIKGYKLFDLESHTVFVSRDVIFHESVFPYVLNSCESNSHPLLPLPCVSAIPTIFDDTIMPKPLSSAIP